MSNECCNNCRYQKGLVKYDYSQGWCIHTDQEGFACLAPDFVIEGQVTWIFGDDGNGQCECYEERKNE